MSVYSASDSWINPYTQNEALFNLYVCFVNISFFNFLFRAGFI